MRTDYACLSLRKISNVVVVSIIIFYSVIATISSYAQGRQRPNIVFILSDDHAYQSIGAYGNKIAKTPNIDRIAREGVRFDNAVVTNSICGPSRATLLTGKYSHVNGYKMNEGKFDSTQPVFPSLMRENGYQTAWIGKWHLGTLPYGFDFWKVLPGQGDYYNPLFITQDRDTVKETGYVTNLITDAALGWLSHRDTSKPFMLIVGEKATHRAWLPDIQDLGLYDSVTFPLPATFYDNYKGRKAAEEQDLNIANTMKLKQDLKVHVMADTGAKRHQFFNRFTPYQEQAFYNYYEKKISAEFDSLHLSGNKLTEWKYQRYIKEYLSTAQSMDRNIGYILDYLERNHLESNTVVVYASDQGFYLGEHGWFDKRFIYDESLKTPFVMRYPGIIKSRTVTQSLVSNIDWAPTILDIAGIKKPDDLQGYSFLPAFTGANNYKERNVAYYHYYEFPEPHHVSPHFGIRTHDFLLVRFYGAVNSWELYDLKKDPHQLTNVIDNKEYSSKLQNLKTQLKEQIIHYKDEEAMEILKK